MEDRYGTVDGFTTYVTARGYDLPATDPDDVGAALVVASDWIDGKYGAEFRASGTLKTGGRAQVLEWPRTGFMDAYGYAIPSDSVPREIEKATYEAAYRQLIKPGTLFTDYVGSKAYKQVHIEGAISVTYAGGASAQNAQIVIPLIGHYLAALIGGQGGTTSVTGYASR